MLDGDVIRKLARSEANYRGGAFCPQVLWEHVTGLLAGHDVERLLDELPPEVQDVLRQAYQARPWSLRNGAAGDEVFRCVERWCQRADP